YVLEGSYVFRIGDETVVLETGDLAFVRRGTPHAYWNIQPLPVRMLVLVTPGGIHERFLASIGEPVEPPAARNGRGFGPPSAFYRQRYPEVRMATARDPSKSDPSPDGWQTALTTADGRELDS